MEELTFDYINKNLPRLGFGLMRLPLTDTNDSSKIDMDLTKKMIDRYIESGFNYFDTAYVYHNGKSENVVKEFLTDRYPREKFFLADKMPIWIPKDKTEMENIFNEQLRRCGVEYIDFYLIHSLNEHNYKKAVELETFDFLKRMKEAGKIRFLGFSFHGTHEELEEILKKHPEVEFVQLQINYLDWYSNLRSDIYYKIAREHNKPIIIMEPIRGGALTSNVPEEANKLLKEHNPEKSLSSWAIRFCASLDGVMTVLSGMTAMEQLDENISTIKNFEKLNDDDYKILKEAAKYFSKTVYIPCTWCKYCSECPQNIDIPGYFDIINEFRQTYNLPVAKTQYSELGNQAESCIACGQCESVCPQGIKIIDLLKYATENFA